MIQTVKRFFNRTLVGTVEVEHTKHKVTPPLSNEQREENYLRQNTMNRGVNNTALTTAQKRQLRKKAPK